MSASASSSPWCAQARGRAAVVEVLLPPPVHDLEARLPPGKGRRRPGPAACWSPPADPGRARRRATLPLEVAQLTRRAVDVEGHDRPVGGSAVGSHRRRVQVDEATDDRRRAHRREEAVHDLPKAVAGAVVESRRRALPPAGCDRTAGLVDQGPRHRDVHDQAQGTHDGQEGPQQRQRTVGKSGRDPRGDRASGSGAAAVARGRARELRLPRSPGPRRCSPRRRTRSRPGRRARRCRWP